MPNVVKFQPKREQTKGSDDFSQLVDAILSTVRSALVAADKCHTASMSVAGKESVTRDLTEVLARLQRIIAVAGAERLADLNRNRNASQSGETSET